MVLIITFSSTLDGVYAQEDVGINTGLQVINSMSIRAAHDMTMEENAETRHLDGALRESEEQIIRSIKTLSNDFRGYSTDETEKVKEIFLWIAKNIDYDVEAVDEANYHLASSYISVFDRGKGLCLGFSQLFATICKHTGMESRVITGYAKGDSYEAEYTFRRPNHAWNSVRINGKWHLLDVAWASSMRMSIESQFGYLPDNQFTDKYLLDFFLVEPGEFLKTHLPEDPFWQLTGTPVRLNTFEAGEEAITSFLASANSNVNFEHIIKGHDALDSLDRVICLFDRIVENPRNNDREYALGLSYFYKAESALEGVQDMPSTDRVLAGKRAMVYYRKALESLLAVDANSLYYDNVVLLSENIKARMDTLGGRMYF